MLNTKLCLQIYNTFAIFIFIALLLLFRYISFYQVVIGYIIYCIYVQYSTKNKLFYTATNKNTNILSQCPSIVNPNYKPYFFLPLYFQQMIIMNLWKVPGSQKLKFKKEPVNKMGVNNYWAYLEGNNELPKDAPIIFFMPGMTGDITDPYVISLVIEGIKNGFNVIVYQNRLISEELELPESGVFNMYDDIDEALDQIRKKCTGKIYAIGGSYGANNLVYYLGLRNKNLKKIEGAVSISNPYDLLLCERLCEGTIFELVVTTLEKNNFKRIKKGIEKCKNNRIDSEYIENCDDMRGYDENLTRKVLGFDSVDIYYRNISAYNMIPNVDVPLLCISSKDDRLTSEKAIPYNEIRMNENIMLIATDRGAHMCYFSNEKIMELKQWVLKPVYEYLNALKSLNENTL